MLTAVGLTHHHGDPLRADTIILITEGWGECWKKAAGSSTASPNQVHTFLTTRCYIRADGDLYLGTTGYSLEI